MPASAPAHESETAVPTALGELAAVVRVPTGAPLPGVVLVDGSGDGSRHDWARWPEWIAGCGSVVLRHDKPGCGGSPGHWTDQTLEDRARESLAALRVLRAHPATSGRPVGLYGVSQGSWVALLAAALEPDAVDFVVCHSGSGSTPARQERERLERAVRGSGLDDAEVVEALAWVDARTDLLRDGRVDDVLTRQAAYADRAWLELVLEPYGDPRHLGFLARILDADPVPVLRQVRCPVLGLFGGADTQVAAQQSLRVFAEHLPVDSRHALAVLPGADHGLFLAGPAPGVDRRDQLAPAYLPTLGAFLAARR